MLRLFNQLAFGKKRIDKSTKNNISLQGSESTQKPAANKWLVSFSLILVFFIILVILIAFTVWKKYSSFKTAFESSAEISVNQVAAMVQDGWNQDVIQDNGKKNILVLGVDQVANRASNPLLTDTILLVSLDVNTADVSMISFPRDLWDDVYQTKINALYSYGDNFYPGQPELLVEETIERLTDLPIHHTVVISLDDVSRLIDILNGIDVVVERGFVDERFPRDDVDISTESDPTILYETVVFEPGLQTFDGETALAFIRSRNSTNSDEGTDLARSARQQKVLEAILTTSMNADTLKNPVVMGKLLRFYLDEVDQFFPFSQVLAVSKNIATGLLEEKSTDLNVTIRKETLPIQTATQSGVLYHPPVSETNNIWTYSVVDEESFKDEVRSILYRNQ